MRVPVGETSPPACPARTASGQRQCRPRNRLVGVEPGLEELRWHEPMRAVLGMPEADAEDVRQALRELLGPILLGPALPRRGHRPRAHAAPAAPRRPPLQHPRAVDGRLPGHIRSPRGNGHRHHPRQRSEHPVRAARPLPLAGRAQPGRDRRALRRRDRLRQPGRGRDRGPRVGRRSDRQLDPQFRRSRVARRAAATHREHARDRHLLRAVRGVPGTGRRHVRAGRVHVGTHPLGRQAGVPSHPA